MGDATERELVERLEAEGYAAMRAPSSGSATTRDLPDVLAGQPAPGGDRPRSRALVFEEKTSSGDPIYVKKAEADALIRFAEAFGARPYIAVRWKANSFRDTTIYVSHPHEMWETEQFWRAKREDCVDGWAALPAVL
jgi:Holliday junction resolvase